MTPIEPVKSKITQEMDALSEKVEKNEEAQKQVAKLLAAIKNGTLSFRVWKKLPRFMQLQYKKKFGRPKTEDQLRGERNRRIRTKKAKKIARKSRAINR